MAKSFYTTGTGNEQTLTPIINEKVPIYDTIADAESDLANLEVGQILKTKDAGLVANLNPIDEVKQGVFLPPTSNAVAKSLSYSTTEQKTGGKWIDGKDIYKMVVTGAVPNGTVLVSNASTMIRQYGNMDLGSAIGMFPSHSISGYASLRQNKTSGDIYAEFSGTWTCNIVVEYTKTTD